MLNSCKVSTPVLTYETVEIELKNVYEVATNLEEVIDFNNEQLATLEEKIDEYMKTKNWKAVWIYKKEKRAVKKVISKCNDKLASVNKTVEKLQKLYNHFHDKLT